MKTNGLIVILMITLTIVPAGFTAQKMKQEDPPGLVLAASDGNRNISLLWFAPADLWPAGGWQVTDRDGNVLVKQVAPLDPETTAGLEPDERQQIRKMAGAVREIEKNGKKEQETFSALLFLDLFRSRSLARAMGLSCTLSDVKPGKKSYRIQSLTGDLRPGKTVLFSPPVDGTVATALPPPPGNLKAVPGLSGAGLFWSPPGKSLTIPVLSFRIERLEDGTPTVVAGRLAKGISWDPGIPAYTDTLAPVETELSYTVYAIDALGRESRASTVTFFMADMSAMMPPTGIETDAVKNRVTLKWQHDDNPNRAGFIVERSSQSDGIYDILTVEPVKPTARTFKDSTVIQGLGYYYRIRSMGTRGDLGEPSAPVKVNVPSGSLPQPTGLTAEINPILVNLTWDRPDFPVAGYFIERRAEKSKTWDRLNSGLLFVRSYKDRFPSGSSGTCYYRVTAASHDHRPGPPSRELKVVRPDMRPPAAPRITGISGENGKVTLFFEPGDDNDTLTAYKIIRDTTDKKQGTVVIPDLSARKHQFTDTGVIPGEAYWYAVVAIGTNRKESPWSRKHLVRVITPEIPRPKKPKANFSKAPFAHVKIEFSPPPENLKITLQRQQEGSDYWQTVAQNIAETGFAVDASPLKSTAASYRIVYQGSAGNFGDPSDPVTIEQK